MIQTLLTFFVSLNTPRMDKLENQQGQLLYEKKKWIFVEGDFITVE